MVDLAGQQQLLYALLSSFSDKPPMLRLSRSNTCYWVCDLPRRSTASPQARQALAAEGYSVLTDEGTGLWQIDLPEDHQLYAACHEAFPMPETERLQRIYSLLRLLQAHPAPFAVQPKEELRALVKLPLLPLPVQEVQLKQLHMACASMLNRRQPLPFAACRTLAILLNEEGRQ